MTESFEQLLEEHSANMQMRPGKILSAIVREINNKAVVVEANGIKSHSSIPKEQFYNSVGDLEVAPGDSVNVVFETVEFDGQTRLSREKAKRMEEWGELQAALDQGRTVRGRITGKVKCGFTVEVGAIRAFLPGSLVDVRPVRDTSHLEGKELEFKVIKLDQKRNNVVLSRRSIVETEGGAEREALLENLQEGQEVKGIVKNLTDYGAFVDLGGVDGLLHITDMAWKRVKHPSEVVSVGDEIMVKVLKFDRERNRVSLGLKQLGDDPWADLARRYPVNTRLSGKVSNITDYGCFVEIETGVEGLVHVSEMDWTNKNVNPAKVVQLGQEVDVIVLDIDAERRRISLGMKQCQTNPWEIFAATQNKGDKVTGKIKSITDFGIFIGLDGGIDGLVHLSDISWNQTGEEAVRNYKKGDEVTAIVLGVDAERERISLGIKQLDQDPFSNFVASNPKGTIVTGTIIEVDSKGAKVVLADDVEGYLKASEYSRERIEDIRNYLKVDEQLEAKVMGVDRKNRLINLSVKAKDSQDEADALQDFRNSDAPINATLGDLLKEHMEDKQS